MNEKSYYANGQLHVDGKPFYIRGAEMQYFRLPKERWAEHLMHICECGMNTVSSYMPWIHHEVREGEFDFDGRTSPDCDLREFLRLAGSLGLKVIARPGPFVNNEYRFGGLPHWLCQNHPEVLSHNASGHIAPGRPCPAEGETVYRNYVKKWYSQIVPILAEFQIDRGGPIIIFQPDNELSAAWSYGLFNSLYDDETIGIRWPAWLKSTYHDISRINQRHGTGFKDFEEVAPPRIFPDSVATRLLAMDWLNFKRDLFADWGATMADYAKEYGITVPLVFNEPIAGFYNHGDHTGFSVNLKKRHPQMITACHTYSDRILDLEGISGLLLGIELTRSAQNIGPAISVEANVNWYIPRLSKSDINWVSLMRLGFGNGLNGNLIFLFSEHCANFKDTIDAPNHWGPGAVSYDGKRNYPFYALQDFNSFFKNWESSVALTQKQSGIRIAYTAGMRYLDFLGAPELLPLKQAKSSSKAVPGGESFNAEPSLDRGQGGAGHDWTDGYEGVSRQTVKPESGIWRKLREMSILCTHLNASFELCDLLHPIQAPGEGMLAIPNTGALEKVAIDYILEHLKNGGQCLFSPNVPAFNDDGSPDNRLLDALGIKLKSRIRPAGGAIGDYGCRVVDFGNKRQMGVHSWLFEYEFPANSRILATCQSASVAASIPVGKGVAFVVGFDPSYTSIPSADFWRSIIATNPLVTCTGNNYYCVIRKSRDMTVITATNAEGKYGKAKIKIQDIPEFELDLLPFESRMLLCNTKILGRRIIYTTSEISPQNQQLNSFRIRGRTGTSGEIAFDRPSSVRINGELHETRQMNSVFTVSYQHTDKMIMEF